MAASRLRRVGNRVDVLGRRRTAADVRSRDALHAVVVELVSGSQLHVFYPEGT